MLKNCNRFRFLMGGLWLVENCDRFRFLMRGHCFRDGPIYRFADTFCRYLYRYISISQLDICHIGIGYLVLTVMAKFLLRYLDPCQNIRQNANNGIGGNILISAKISAYKIYRSNPKAKKIKPIVCLLNHFTANYFRCYN